MAVTAGVSIGVSAPTGAATTIALTTSGAVPAASRIVIAAGGWDSLARTITGVSGGGLTWVEDADAQHASGEVVGVYSADAPSGLASGTVITVTFSASVDDRFVGGWYMQGAVTGSNPATYRGTVVNGNSQGTGTGWTTGNMASIDAGALIFAATNNAWATPATRTSAPVAPSVEIHDIMVSSEFGDYVSEYQTIASAGTYAVAGTLSASGDHKITVGIEYLAAAEAQAAGAQIYYKMLRGIGL